MIRGCLPLAKGARGMFHCLSLLFLYHKDTKNQLNNQHISILYLTCFHTTFHALRNLASAGLIFVMSSGRQDFLILNF